MASKKKIRRRVLGASCILAALIVAGASFAWFSSQDEVTNQLTATADYGVSIVEDFTPPKDMTPGQTVNKDVSVVNTGSVDAFVRGSLTDEMSMTRLSSIAYNTPAADNQTVYKKTDGTVVIKAYNDPKADDETKLYDLKSFASTLPDLSSTTVIDEFVFLDPQENLDATGEKNANEVTTLMAGGQLVVAASKAVAPETAVRSGDDVNGATKLDIIYNVSGGTQDGNKVVKDGDDYYTVSLNQNGLYEKSAAAVSMGNNYTLTVDTLARDYSGAAQYKPVDTGLYIFKRNNNKYSGFYYDSTQNKFYALKTEDNNKSAYIDFGTGGITYAAGVVDSITGVELRTKETGIDNTKGTWTLEFVKYGTADDDTTVTAASGAGNNIDATHLKATFHVTSDDADTSKDVKIYIKLADNWSNNWTFVDGTVGTGKGYFYYNTKLESGVTSAPLIDSVKLDSNMGSANYLDMKYNLKVALDSVQVTKDQYGNETVDAVDSWNGITATPNKTNGVITNVAWA